MIQSGVSSHPIMFSYSANTKRYKPFHVGSSWEVGNRNAELNLDLNNRSSNNPTANVLVLNKKNLKTASQQLNNNI